MRHYTIFKYILWSICVVLFYIFFLYNPEAKSSINTTDVLTINVVPLKKQNISVTNEYVGYITPIKSVNLAANVSGYIDEIWVEGGQEVREGDNLVLIDQREYKAELDAAKANVKQAKANYNNALTYYNRMKKAGKKAVSASALDDAKAKFLATEALLKQAEAEEQKAKTLYDYTVLQSPINGIVGNVALTKGNYVTSGNSSLLSIIQFDPIRVMFAIPDKEYLSEIKKYPTGNLFETEEIKIRLADGNVYEKTGTFKFTDNQVNKNTNSVTIFADFSNKDKTLLANSYVDVLLSKKLNNVFLIRQNFATIKDDGVFIYIMQNGELKQVNLDIAGYYNDYYVVENKFGPKDFLVIDKIGKIDPKTELKMKIAEVTTEKK
ncbi:MAG: efflux RND transporter periplasmic adaptor subunit [Alphaproteobacteria bacterium]|nr:efflux RND transporter periplasmic adaptor subunit [Alphaproteobacteria bacterium]